jgi:threonine/homoserine/homoserine lactone efflux protein
LPDHAHLTAFVAAALVLAVTPGPGIFYVLARSLGEGTRIGVRSTLGTALGGLCHVVGAALQLLALGTLSVALNSSVDLVVATLGGRARGGLRAGSRWVRRQRALSGVALIALGGYAAAADRR